MTLKRILFTGKTIPFCFHLIVFYLLSPVLKGQITPDICQTTLLILDDLEKYHFSPPEFNEVSRKEIVTLFMEDLDPKGIYFLSNDKKILDSVVNVVGNTGLCMAIEKGTSIYIERLKQTDSIISVFLSKAINFNFPDTIIYKVHEAVSFQDNVKSLQRQIEKRLKFGVLLSMHELKNDSLSKMNESKIEEQARDKILKSFRRKTHHLLNDKTALKKYTAERFWNAMALRCDPHSNYFNNDDKQNFEKELSSEELSYGIVINENENGEIVIVKLIPGSPAWKANELNEGDILTGASLADGKKFDFSSMSEEEVEQLIESASSGQIQFSIKKKNNMEKKVTLVKEKIHSEQNYINGYILADSLTRIGYIPLPAFYTDFENDNPLGCANDVAKEILKLKKENIKGLILDLRDNGGGSLREAVELAGIFIDEGPMGILKFRDRKPVVLRDMNRGTVYDGPLLVLVNGLSASASEFLSAVLQDYKRAIISGRTTYGKGTGQDIIAVDSLAKFSSQAGKGYLKLTEFKFYRVNNSTNQAKGVIPDIELPEIYMSMDYFKESSEPFHLLADTVAKKAAYHSYDDIPLDYLKQKSILRTQQHAQFRLIKSFADSIYSQEHVELKLALNPRSINRYLEQTDIFEKNLDDLSKYETKSFQVINNQYLNYILAIDSDKKEENEMEMRAIKSDVELEEAFFILNDFINYHK